jgi:hypothetical protein
MDNSNFIKHNFERKLTEELEELDINTVKEKWEKGDHARSYVRLHDMATRLANNMRGISFAWKREGHSPELWVYMKDMPYTMGYIGYGDFNTHVSGAEDEYAVYSHPIENNKYSDYSTPYHMVRTIHETKAVKNACKWLRNPNAYDVASLHIHDAKRKFNDIGYNLSQKLRNLSNTMYDEDKLAKEFKSILDSGYEFIDKSFGGAVSDFLEAYDVSRARDRKTLSLYHVRVYMEDGQQKFDVVPFDNVHTNSFTTGVDNPSSVVSTYTEDTIPEDIMGKLSCLTMLGKGEFVDDVGYKESNGCFYVTQ